MKCKAAFAAVCVAATAAFVPTAGAETQQAIPSPFDRGGRLTATYETPGSDMIWSARARDDRPDPLSDQIVSYEPGTGWTQYELPESNFARSVLDIAMESPTAGWAIDYNQNVGTTRLLRFDGTGWTLAPAATLPDGVDPWLVAASGPGDVWLYADGPESYQPRLWHWDGGEWTEMNVSFDGSPGDLVATGPDSAWMLSDNYQGSGWFVDTFIYRWDGTRWTRWSPPDSHERGNLTARGGNVWFSFNQDSSANYQLRHRHGDVWRTVAVREGYDPYSPQISGEDGDLWTLDGVAQTHSYKLHRATETGWTQRAIPDLCNSGRSHTLSEFTINGSGDMYVVGSCGNGDTTRTLALRWDGSTWTRV